MGEIKKQQIWILVLLLALPVTLLLVFVVLDVSQQPVAGNIDRAICGEIQNLFGVQFSNCDMTALESSLHDHFAKFGQPYEELVSMPLVSKNRRVEIYRYEDDKLINFEFISVGIRGDYKQSVSVWFAFYPEGVLSEVSLGISVF